MGAEGKKLLKDLAYLKRLLKMIFPRNHTFFYEELMKIVIYNLM